MTKPAFQLNLSGVLFFGLHALAISAFFVKPDLTAILLCVGLFLVRKFGITGGYHRYFSHRSFKTSRWFQFVLAWLGGMSAQKGALWWAAHHRHHHQHSDQEDDIHSVKQQGFYWAHVGWVLAPDYNEYDAKRVKDLTKFPELVFIDRHHIIPPLVLAVATYLFGLLMTGTAMGGLTYFLWGFCLSTVILYHTTFAINSFCHLLGSRRYETGESSRNSFILAIVTLGEGWHNNHHYYPHCARQGFFWWEIDPTYYVIKALKFVGIVHDIKEPNARVLEGKEATASLG
ncbi:stearoyl-CoA desaturase (delta-9 desaturase) [Prosthecobacter fusiformis]|uniref:Stearoyl-CoA desaturase (Delta-9 desaturase) n=1 Tax=Prosthecobacter fusiformis TaxID=48464 RepID=A0A4R7RUI5_9BACT|nr:fatty acid desaturase [Prosthecobacter fusiformis]TDU68097.1 stearoyl-CoA desaturase (delta-9 desaturase) [Prosthecobacter fusiformis]